MRVLRAVVDVPASPEAVQKLVLDPAHAAGWRPRVRDLQADRGWPARGAALRWREVPLGPFWRAVVAANHLPREITLQWDTPRGPVFRMHRFQALAGGRCRYTLAVQRSHRGVRQALSGVVDLAEWTALRREAQLVARILGQPAGTPPTPAPSRIPPPA